MGWPVRLKKCWHAWRNPQIYKGRVYKTPFWLAWKNQSFGIMTVEGVCCGMQTLRCTRCGIYVNLDLRDRSHD